MERPAVVYGIHAVEELIAKRPGSIDHIYFDKDRCTTHLFGLLKICRKERLAYNLVPLQKVTGFAGTAVHQGVVALCSVMPYCTSEELKAKFSGKASPLFVLAASIEDPQNLGALVRSCVAFGADALLLERKNTAPLSPAVAKASSGMVEHCIIARPRNLEGLVGDYRASGFAVIGADAAQGVPPALVDFKGPSIIVLGGEHRGIPPYLKKMCTCFTSIPTDSRVSSLNVSAAGAIVLYECARQRMKNKGPEAA